MGEGTRAVIKTKKDWDAADHKAFFDDLYRVAASASIEEKRAKYAELEFVLVNEKAPMLVTDAQRTKWNAAIASLHEAYYGFAPGRLTDAQIQGALGIDEHTIRRASAAVSGLVEAMDGASLKQLVSAAKKQLRVSGIKLAPKLIERLVAAFEGFPIPPA